MAFGKSSLSFLPKLLSSPSCQLGYLCTKIYWLFSFWLGLEGKTGRTHSFHPVIPNIQQLEKAVLAAKRLWSAAARNIPWSMQNDIRVGKWPWLPTKGRIAMQHKTVQVPLVDRIRREKNVLHLFGTEPAMHLFLNFNWLAVFSFTDSRPLKDQWIYIV